MDIKQIGERAHMRAAASAIRGMYCMVEEIDRLTDEVGRLTVECERLRGRALPEGISWPRFEDGEPVRFGDETDLTNPVTHIWFECEDDGPQWGIGDRSGDFIVRPGECVKRPQPCPEKPVNAAQRGTGDAPGCASDSWEKLGRDMTAFARYCPSLEYDERVLVVEALIRRAKALGGAGHE